MYYIIFFRLCVQACAITVSRKRRRTSDAIIFLFLLPWMMKLHDFAEMLAHTRLYAPEMPGHAGSSPDRSPLRHVPSHWRRRRSRLIRALILFDFWERWKRGISLYRDYRSRWLLLCFIWCFSKMIALCCRAPLYAAANGFIKLLSRRGMAGILVAYAFSFRFLFTRMPWVRFFTRLHMPKLAARRFDFW